MESRDRSHRKESIGCFFEAKLDDDASWSIQSDPEVDGASRQILEILQNPRWLGISSNDHILEKEAWIGHVRSSVLH